MNEYLPYEEQLQQQLKDLPLPDENKAWEDMQRRLEEEEDRKPFFIWLRGCAGWGLLGILLLGLGWWLLRPGGLLRKKEDSVPVIAKIENPQTTQKDTAARIEKGKDKPVVNAGEMDTTTVAMNQRSTDSSRVNPVKDPINEKLKEKKERVEEKNGTIIASPGTKSRKKTNQPARSSDRNRKLQKPEKKQRPDTLPPDNPIKLEPAPIAKDRTVEPKPDSLAVFIQKNVKTDSIKESATGPVNKNPDSLARENKPKKDSAKKNSWEFSVGTGIHQQIPLGGQKLTPYNSLGRKGSLADYIPSVYARAGRKNKWFFQAEFRYGAPQYTKQFAFRQTVIPDTGSNPVYSTVTSSSLKKTFYHQLPFTFNYFFRPGWSVGAGFQWNVFKSAVSEREVLRKNNFTQLDSLVSKDILTQDTAGSTFRKSYWQAVIETQYKWKRFSIGAKYAFGLEPYIRFALPGQPIRQERNHALQAFIRYQLWRNKK